MQSNNLSSQQVVSRSNISWDLELLLSAVPVDDIGSPHVLRNQSVLVNLEPARAGRGEGIVDLGHVDNDWTIVVTADGLVSAASVTWLSVHLNSDSSTSVDLAHSRGVGSSATTTNSRRSSADWAVVQWETGTGAGLVDTVDPELLPCRVSGSRCDEAKEGDRVELHVEMVRIESEMCFNV